MPPANDPTTAVLIAAVEKSNVAVAKGALDRGGDVSARNADRVTLLCIATLAGSMELVDLLIGHGADVNAVGYGHMTALHLAARDGRTSFVRRLIDAGAPASERVLDDILHVASMSVNSGPHIVTLLEGVRISWARPSAPKGEGDASARLRSAVHDGKADEAAAALAAGADPLQRDGRGMDALSWAALRGHAPVVSLLLEHGVSPDLLNGVGWSSLGQACGQGHPGVVERLIAGGADVNLRFEGGKTALHCAAHEGFTEIVRILLRGGATGARLADDDGYTPLQLAMNQGHAEIVALLNAPRSDASATDPKRGS